MSDTYTIIIINKYKKDQKFLLFNDVPKASDENGNDLQPFTNVFASNGIAGDNGTPGQGSFEIPSESFAVCGDSPNALGNGVIIKNSHSQPVKLGPSNDGSTDMNVNSFGTPVLSKPGSTKTVGGYDIVAKPYDSDRYPNVWCGYGKKSGTKIVPVASWPSEPATTYKIFPKVIYYISTGSYQTGEIVDVGTIGQVATVDFSGRKERYATVTKEDNNTYGPVVYHFDLKAAANGDNAGDEGLSNREADSRVEQEAF